MSDRAEILIDGSLQKIKHIFQIKYFEKIKGGCAVTLWLECRDKFRDSLRATAQQLLDFPNIFLEKKKEGRKEGLLRFITSVHLGRTPAWGADTIPPELLLRRSGVEPTTSQL